MYKIIAVAVDSSETSKHALQEAINLAHFHKAKLIILHIADITLPQDADIGYLALDIDKYQASIIINGRKMLNEMAAMANSVGVENELQLVETQYYGSVPSKINEAVEKLGPEILVMGTQGRKGLQRFFLGSVAENVIRSSKIPVLMVRGQIVKDHPAVR